MKSLHMLAFTFLWLFGFYSLTLSHVVPNHLRGIAIASRHDTKLFDRAASIDNRSLIVLGLTAAPTPAQKPAVQKPAVQKQAVQKQAVQKQAVQKQAAQKPAVQKQPAPPRPASPGPSQQKSPQKPGSRPPSPAPAPAPRPASPVLSQNQKNFNVIKKAGFTTKEASEYAKEPSQYHMFQLKWDPRELQGQPRSTPADRLTKDINGRHVALVVGTFPKNGEFQGYMIEQILSNLESGKKADPTGDPVYSEMRVFAYPGTGSQLVVTHLGKVKIRFSSDKLDNYGR
jgi:hypothetical protein